MLSLRDQIHSPAEALLKLTLARARPYHAKRADQTTRRGSAPVVYDQSDAYAGLAGSHTSCFKKLYLFFRGVLRCLMQHSIYGVQISSCTGFDYICACAFACDEPAATEVAF